MKIKHFLPIGFFLIGFFLPGCEDTKSILYSDDFYMIYADETDQINLKDNTFTRTYVSGDSTIQLRMKPDEMEKFYDIITKNKGWEIRQQDLNKECKLLIMPDFPSTLEISRNNDPPIQLYWSMNSCGKRVKDLNKITGEILKTIYSKEEVENLRKTDLIFF